MGKLPTSVERYQLIVKTEPPQAAEPFRRQDVITAASLSAP